MSPETIYVIRPHPGPVYPHSIRWHTIQGKQYITKQNYTSAYINNCRQFWDFILSMYKPLYTHNTNWDFMP